MELSKLKKQADAAGDFFLNFRRADGGGQTYLVGTFEFDNKYILNRMHNKTDPCGLPFSLLKRITSKTSKAERINALNKLVADAERKCSVLVFSWSSNRFRLIPSYMITRVSPLNSILRNGS